MIQPDGKRILITGASRGFGLAVATALAERGWRLLIDARDGARLREAAERLREHTEVMAIAGDVSDPAHRAALRDAGLRMGGIDAIINNAGILGPSPQPTLLDYPIEALAEVYRINVLAPLAVIQTLKDLFTSGATIINVTSDAAVEAYPGWGGYGSSKSALEQISAVLAAENPDLNVYQFDPGDMRTRMHQDAFPGEDISDRPLPEESVPALLHLLGGELPAGRYKASALQQAPVAEEAVR